MLRHVRFVTSLGTVGTLALVAMGCNDMEPGPTAPAQETALASSHGSDVSTARRARVFNGTLQPLNPDLSFRPVMGDVQARIQGDRLTVIVHATGLEPGIPHPQHIHGVIGGGPGTCPDMSDDANGDGVLDVIEGVPDYGPILVTLDSDITNGAATEVDGLPNPSNHAGSIQYRMTASLSDVEAGAGGALDLGSRHIVLHGVDPETPLPTAASLGGLPAWLTLPVACAELAPTGG